MPVFLPSKKPRRLFIKNAVKFAFSFTFSFALGITTTQVVNNSITHPVLWFKPTEGHEVPRSTRVVEYQLAMEIRAERNTLHTALLECQDRQPQRLEGSGILPITVQHDDGTAQVGEAKLSYHVDQEGQLHGGIDVGLVEGADPLPSLLWERADSVPETVRVLVPGPPVLPETVIVIEYREPTPPPYNGWRGQGPVGDLRRPGDE